ncbi:MAG: alkaline phosphatase D family protein [Ilumatobacteraceae bacterium]
MFTLGVASGEPTPDGVVLWTRLAPDPLMGGGMPDRPDRCAVGDRQRRPLPPRRARGIELARPELGHSVHVEVGGLRPGAWYWYRFRTMREVSPVGRTRTAPAVGAPTDRLAFALTSCQAYTDGYFTAHRHMAEEDLDLVVQVGDYIYEGAPNAGVDPGRTRGRASRSPSSSTATDTPSTGATPTCRRATPRFPGWSCSTTTRSTTTGRTRSPRTRRCSLATRSSPGAQRPSRRTTSTCRCGARRSRAASTSSSSAASTFGDLLDVHVLDTRQYRSDQDQTRRLDPSRTILGDEQERWLLANLAGPTARWNALAQQVFFSEREFTAGPAESYSDDAWDNYVPERDGLRDRIAAVGTTNPVILTGDVHASYVCDVKADFDDPASETVATELVGSSITSGRDGVENDAGRRRPVRREPAHQVHQPQARLRAQRAHPGRVDGGLSRRRGRHRSGWTDHDPCQLRDRGRALGSRSRVSSSTVYAPPVATAPASGGPDIEVLLEDVEVLDAGGGDDGPALASPRRLARTLALSVLIAGIAVLAVQFHRTGHPQGDDFALYLRQARAVFAGNTAEVVADNRFAVANSDPLFSPDSYPWGFPLLLSPFVRLWGLDYERLKLVEVAVLCLSLVLIHGVVRRRTNAVVAWFVVATLGLSSAYLAHTGNLLSEFPHVLAVVTTIWFLDRTLDSATWFDAARWRLVVLGLLAAAAFNVRREGARARRRVRRRPGVRSH